MAVYGYVRVSTTRQADEGESLAQQQRQLRGYADMHALDVARVYVEEGVSGSTPIQDRPQGSALFASLAPGDIVLSPKLDRCFRSALDALQVVDVLKKRGVALHLLDLGGDIAQNGLSKLFLTIAAAFAEAERDRIRERVSIMKADQKARGRYLGGAIPFGFVVGEDGALVEAPEATKAVQQMQEMRAAKMSLRSIADHVTSLGMPITHQGVKKVLARGL